MLEVNIQQHPGQLYRIDKFKVPPTARAEFLQKVQLTHAVLKTQPGFIQDFIFEQIGGPGEFNFVTVAVWESAEAMGVARQAVITTHQEIGFKPAEMFERLGIKADVANYTQLEA
ncbi:MAG: antibiotic biosynthesis monooxygenase family protein [Anaerolineae bacterium]